MEKILNGPLAAVLIKKLLSYNFRIKALDTSLISTFATLYYLFNVK